MNENFTLDVFNSFGNVFNNCNSKFCPREFPLQTISTEIKSYQFFITETFSIFIIIRFKDSVNLSTAPIQSFKLPSSVRKDSSSSSFNLTGYCTVLCCKKYLKTQKHTTIHGKLIKEQTDAVTQIYFSFSTSK